MKLSNLIFGTDIAYKLTRLIYLGLFIMEVIENSSLNALFNNQKFKTSGESAMQSSFIAELDMSINAADVAKSVDNAQPIEPSKNDKPKIVEEEKAEAPEQTEKSDKTNENKDVNAKKSETVAENNDATQEETPEVLEQEMPSDKQITEKNTINDSKQNTLESTNVNEMAGKDYSDEISAIKTGDIKNEGGQDSLKANKEIGTEISQDQTAVSEIENTQNVEISPQVVQVAQAQVATQESIETTEPTIEDYIKTQVQQSVPSAENSANENVEMQDLFEAPQVQKSPEIKAQEQAIAQKIEKPDAKLNIEVEVEQAGFDFSAPKVVVADGPKEVDAGIKTAEIVKTLTIDTQAILPDATKAIAGSVQNISSQAQDVAGKTQANNIAPIGLEVANKVSKFNEAASTQKTANNDNLKAMSKEVIDQIKVNITKSAVKGVDVIDIKLKPEDLGELSIKIELKKEDGSVEIVISASNKETLELLQKDAANLQKAFEDAGYKMGENSLSFSEQGQEQKQENAQKQARINFMADALSEQVQEETIYQGNTALNIKV